MSLGGCLSSYTAQNLGAGKRERIPMGFKTGVKLSLYATVPFFLLYFVFSRQMMGLFLGAESTKAIQS
ncbi:MATE family efflux transporter, partial [Eggerthella lenta]|nr:MATE family efflux transporter [Eggerthella lenta]